MTRYPGSPTAKAVAVNSELASPTSATSAWWPAAPSAHSVLARPASTAACSGAALPPPSVTRNATVAPSIGCPLASSTRTVGRTGSTDPSRALWPSPSVFSSRAGTCCTHTSPYPRATRASAAISAVPFPVAVTSPVASTVATEASLLVQSTVVPAITFAFWSLTSAVSRTVAPSAVSAAVGGLTVTVAGNAGSVGPSPSPHPSARATTTTAADNRKTVR